MFVCCCGAVVFVFSWSTVIFLGVLGTVCFVLEGWNLVMLFALGTL